MLVFDTNLPFLLHPASHQGDCLLLSSTEQLLLTLKKPAAFYFQEAVLKQFSWLLRFLKVNFKLSFSSKEKKVSLSTTSVASTVLKTVGSF